MKDTPTPEVPGPGKPCEKERGFGYSGGVLATIVVDGLNCSYGERVGN